MKLKVNGREHDLTGIDRDMPLLWALREKFNLTVPSTAVGAHSAGRARFISMVRRSGRARCPCTMRRAREWSPSRP